MRDFIRGTLGMLGQIFFLLLSVGLLLGSIGAFIGENAFLGIVLIILGIVSWCAIFGVRYWLGHVTRLR